MDPIHLVIPMRCASKREGARVSRGKRSPIFKPQSYKDKQVEFKKLLMQQLTGKPRPVFTGEVGFFAILFFADKRRRDLDNLEGFIWDCCNKILWYDDYLVVKNGAEKYSGVSSDRIELTVWEYKDGLCRPKEDRSQTQPLLQCCGIHQTGRPPC